MTVQINYKTLTDPDDETLDEMATEGWRVHTFTTCCSAQGHVRKSFLMMRDYIPRRLAAKAGL